MQLVEKILEIFCYFRLDKYVPKVSKVHYFSGHKMRLTNYEKNIRHEEQGSKNLITYYEKMYVQTTSLQKGILYENLCKNIIDSKHYAPPPPNHSQRR